MAYKSFRVSDADMTEYYLPKTDDYQQMISSISDGPTGYGQIIYNYNGPGDYTVNSYNVWESRSQSMVVIDTIGTIYSESDAGPNLWGVGSQTGIDFLNGTTSIEGIIKLKYCNNCTDGNGLPLPTITSFKNRFTYLDIMKQEYGTTEGYLFYDYSLSNSQKWFATVFDGNISNYIFRDPNGNTKYEAQVSAETGILPQDITSSIENSEPIKPITATSSTIVNCCDGSTTFVIDGVYPIGSVLYTKDVFPAQCYQVTKNSTDRADNFFMWIVFGEGRSACGECTSSYESCK